MNQKIKDTEKVNLGMKILKLLYGKEEQSKTTSDSTSHLSLVNSEVS